MSTVWNLLKVTFQEWRDDNVTRLAAALSYYTAISVAPLLILTLTVVSLFVDTNTVRDELSHQIQNLVGQKGGEALLAVLENADQPQAASVAGILGLLTLLWGASNVFVQLQDSLNTIWDVELKPTAGFWMTVRERFLSFAMVLVIGFLLLISLVVSAAIALMGNRFSTLLPGADWVWQVVNLAVSFVVTTLLFALIYKVLPDVRIGWRDVLSGAAVTALIFAVGKYLLGLYLGMQSLGSAYGAAGSLVVFLIWVFFSAQIVFFGAEFTQVHARHYGRGFVPKKYARFTRRAQKPPVTPATTAEAEHHK
jgi:membrane protein